MLTGQRHVQCQIRLFIYFQEQPTTLYQHTYKYIHTERDTAENKKKGCIFHVQIKPTKDAICFVSLTSIAKNNKNKNTTCLDTLVFHNP